MLRAAALSLLLATPALADVEGALSGHILPAFATLDQAAADLDRTAAADCRPAAVQPAFHATFDAWIPLSALRLGPSESGALTMAFWPDDRGHGQRALTRMIAQQDPMIADATAYAEVSVAARGLFALELLLDDPAFNAYAPGDYTCRLVQRVAADLAAQATALHHDWQDFAPVIRSAGAPGNATFLDQDEAFRAIYTQILSGLEFTVTARLGRPLGTFDRPAPRLAEARRSGRSRDNVVLAAQGAVQLAHALADWPLPQTDAALTRVEAAARATDPAFQGVADPAGRLKVEVLQQAVQALHDALVAEIGARQGIGAGFNAQDGD